VDQEWPRSDSLLGGLRSGRLRGARRRDGIRAGCFGGRVRVANDNLTWFCHEGVLAGSLLDGLRIALENRNLVLQPLVRLLQLSGFVLQRLELLLLAAQSQEAVVTTNHVISQRGHNRERRAQHPKVGTPVPPKSCHRSIPCCGFPSRAFMRKSCAPCTSHIFRTGCLRRGDYHVNGLNRNLKPIRRWNASKMCGAAEFFCGWRAPHRFGEASGSTSRLVPRVSYNPES